MSKPTETTRPFDLDSLLAGAATGRGGWLARPIARSIVAVAAGVVVLASLWSLTGRTATVRYGSEPATTGNLTVLVTATGSVQPINKVDVSSELSGTVRKVLVDYNSVVVAGQTLAELDTDKLIATVESSRARLAAAKARVRDAEATVVEKEKDLARKKTLASKQISSAHDLDTAQAAYDRALASVASTRADVGVAEADLKLNETNFSKACICAPISGIILKRNVDPGQTVAASLQAPVLFSLAENLKQMELQIDIDEADVGKVRVGHPATFGVDAFPERRFPASIRDVRFASETVQGVVTYKAVLNVDNSELLLRPGMTATAEIRVSEIQNALLIPNAALRYVPPKTNAAPEQSLLRRMLPGPPRFQPASPHEEKGPNRSVWVLRNGQPQEVRVAIGVSDGKKTQVLSGALQTGEAVVVDQTTGKP